MTKQQKIVSMVFGVSLLLAGLIAFEHNQSNQQHFAQELERETGLHEAAQKFVDDCVKDLDSAAERFDAYGVVCKQVQDDLALTGKNIDDLKARAAQSSIDLWWNMVLLTLIFNAIAAVMYAFERWLTRWEQTPSAEPHD